MDPKELKTVFKMFDKNGDGRISRMELNESLKNLGIHIPEDELSRMIDKLDVNGDGCIDVDEFESLYKEIVGEQDEEEDIREAFNVFDQNGDGFITVEELRHVLGSLGLSRGRGMHDYEKMITSVDVDGDGRVNYIEFKKMIKTGGFRALH